MANTKKLIQAAAGNAGGAGLNVEEVFSTYLYDGTGSAQTITNGIDLSGEGGMVWIKGRNFSDAHALFDTERGFPTWLVPNDSSLDDSYGTPNSSDMVANSDGFSINNISSASNSWNSSGNSFASWTWRKAPRFFDCVTYTGDGVAGREIAHNLGSVPGMVIVKKRSGGFGDAWTVNHRSIPSTQFLSLNSTQAASTTSTRWNDTDPTDTVFTVGDDTSVNYSGYTYVAYLFANNDGDGEFGPDGDADIIKCGSYTGTGSNGNYVDVGFEPQWVLVKNASSAANWYLYDTMRGFGVGPSLNYWLSPNLSNAESGEDKMFLDSQGFYLNGNPTDYNASGDTYIYIAIRRGPMAVPEDATDVFEPTTRVGSAPRFSTGFPVDMHIRTNRNGGAKILYDRFRLSLRTDTTDAASTGPAGYFASNEGVDMSTGGVETNEMSWNWRRAPNYFDAVAYTGTGSAGLTVGHNLGVAPEMMWIKRRDAAGNWMVLFNMSGSSSDDMTLEGAGASNTRSYPNTFLNSSPTATEIVLGSNPDVNNSSTSTHIAYLFASLDGVSKVGSYTGNGGTQTIDCGFTSGARFVLIKRTDSTSDWALFDSARGIVLGNDPLLRLNETLAEVTDEDIVDPISSGFIVNSVSDRINVSGGSYIFYAIA